MLIDAIIYNGERDLLAIRLNELWSMVDKFVIVESLEYHGSNRKKSYPLPPGAGLDQIHYILLDHLEPPFAAENSWKRENYHRDAIMPHIVEVANSSQDIVMLSDCDEIPRASALYYHYPGNQLMGTAQDMFYYNVNNYVCEWHGTVMGKISDFMEIGGLQPARNKRDELPRIPNCGWHFSYFGGLERIRHKAENFAHANEDICKLLKCQPDEEVLKDIAEGRDLYHRPGPLMEKRSSDDPRLPKYFLDNKERFRNLWTT